MIENSGTQQGEKDGYGFYMNPTTHEVGIKVTPNCYTDIEKLLQHPRFKKKKFDIITLGMIWKCLKPHFKELQDGDEEDDS